MSRIAPLPLKAPLQTQERRLRWQYGLAQNLPAQSRLCTFGTATMGKAKRGKDREGQYAPLTYPMLKSPAWKALSGAAVRIFLELHTRFNGSNNGKLFLSLNEAAKALGIGKATAQRAFDDLQAKGFLVRTKAGNWYGRQAHEWRMTHKPVEGPRGREPATNDWRNWVPPKTEHGSKMGPSAQRVVPFQNPEPVFGSNLKPVKPKSEPRLSSRMKR